MSRNALLPFILELELRVVELEGRGDEVCEDVGAPRNLGLAVAANNVLALPWLADLTDLVRECSNFNHDTHLGAESDLVGHYIEHELVFLLGGLARD